MDALRIVALGGFANVTQNMFAYHYLPQGKEKGDQILLVDCGVGFPEEDALGVDLVIPDISYLKGKEGKIVGIVLTHGHEDHIGALPFVLPQLPARVPVFASRLTAALIEDKLQEGGINRKINLFDSGNVFRLGKFLISPIRVTHSIPDTYHFFIETPVGNFYHGSDFKFDFTPPDNVPSEIRNIALMGEKKILALLSDCLGADKDGYSPSEATLDQMFEDQIRQAKGRVFVTAISSNIYRWQRAIEASRKFGRKIALLGFSVKKMVKIAKELGYLDFGQEVVKLKKALNLPDRKVTFLVAGSLAQTGSSLEKIVLGKHEVKIKPGDKVIFSSPDYIPGTTKAIHRLIDTLIQQGAEVVYGDSTNGTLHVSGHGYQQELALLISLLAPKYLIPIGGEWRQANRYLELAKKMGYHQDRILVPKEGIMPTFWSNGRVDFDFKLKLRRVLIDGLGIGDVGKMVLRDRKILSAEGMIAIILLVDNEDKSLTEMPVVVSRGFVYVKKNRQLLEEIKREVKRIFEQSRTPVFDLDNVRYQIQGKLEEFIYQKTGRQPMVLPVVLEI